MDRFDRQRQLFGDQGQARLRATSVGIVGAGGVGSFVALELAYLGIGMITLVDADTLETSNRNRLVGAWVSHAEGTPKAEILGSLIADVDPSIQIKNFQRCFPSREADEALSSLDVIVGCVDHDGARLELNDFCCERGIPLIDAASDTFREKDNVLFGGRVCVATEETGCLYCFGILDQGEIRAYSSGKGERADEAALYGVPKEVLTRGGPSVVSVNGVIASIAVTELMVLVVGIRDPIAYQDWRGHEGTLRRVVDRESGCYYCGLRARRQLTS